MAKTSRKVWSPAAKRAAERAEEAERVIERFVELVQDLPQVRQVLSSDSSGYLAVLTVIEGPRMDIAVREPIHQAEFDAMGVAPETPVDWDIVNLTEYPGRCPETILPSSMVARLVR